MTDDYSNAPQSVAELKANKEHSARFWTPRDMLVSTLRDIDSGKLTLKGAVIMFIKEEGEEKSIFTNYKVAGVTFLESLGLIESCKNDIITDSTKK